MVIGMWLGTLPVGLLAKRFGRRFALQTGSLFGMVSGLISYSAVMQGNFWLLLIGTFCGGLYAAAHQSYRFAAADTASEAYRPKVVSWVLAGGVFAAVIGPQLVIFTKDLLSPHLFAASYLGQSACAVLAALVLMFVKVPPVAAERIEHARPLTDRARAAFHRRRRLRGGELRHDEHDHDLGAARHGRLRPFGDRRHARHPVARAGDVCAELRHRQSDRALRRRAHHRHRPRLVGLAAVVGIAGITVAHFWTVLVLLGLGWNFAFIGATTMVTQCHRPEERNKVQAFNDFLIFGSMALSSFSSGQLLANVGWPRSTR